MQFNTSLIHGKQGKPDAFGSTLPPVYQVSAYEYETAERLEQVFSNKATGYAYSRIGNPTVTAFEERICQLENGIAALACSSGSAAIAMALLNVLQAGDEIISGTGLYGGTIDFFNDIKAFGITVKYTDDMTAQGIAHLISEKTKLIFTEIIGNPKLNVIDIKELADFAHSKGLPLFVDSTTATPYLIRPIDFGADIVIHSSSKYINGSGNSISGVIVDSGNFKWGAEKFPQLSEYKKFGKFAYIAKLRNGLWRNFGACLAPLNAYLNCLGLETLGLRMERLCENAFHLAKSLSNNKFVTSISYPSLDDSGYSELVKKQFYKGFGGAIITIRVGSKEKAYSVINNLKYAKNASNIGDLRTLVIHPYSTLFIHNGKEQREKAGVYEDLIRISVGIEDIEDLISDFNQALENACNTGGQG